MKMELSSLQKLHLVMLYSLIKKFFIYFMECRAAIVLVVVASAAIAIETARRK